MTADLRTPSGLALLSNVTAESLALKIEKTLQKKVWTAPGFDTWQSELLNPSSPLWTKEIRTIFVLLHGAPFSAFLGAAAQLEERLASLLSTIKHAQENHPDKAFVVSSLDLPSPVAPPLVGGGSARRASFFWRAALEEANIPVLDVEELVSEAGRERFYSAKMWYFGALPFSMQGEELLAREILRIDGVLRGRRKKCLVLDLDGTLWGGVIGEDSLEGISLAAAGLGSQYADVQRVARALSEQGVLLAICSKNNIDDALLPFREHPDTVLRCEDFVAIRANWDPKPINIASIAEELNIGLDSFVFIDDNPLEREAVRVALPEVAVPDFPKDSSQLPTFMLKIAKDYFGSIRVEDEDREKTAMYRAESQRETERATHVSLEDYLLSLDMRLDLHRLRPEEIARAAQLTQKTNQFNLTGRRYTEVDLTAMMREKNVRMWIAALSDRFGNYGRVLFAIARLAPDSTAFIDTFLMSCRVMGRGVEAAALSSIERELESEGVAKVYGELVVTPKNTPVHSFWPSMEYSPEVFEGMDRWSRNAPFTDRKTFVQAALLSG